MSEVPPPDLNYNFIAHHPSLITYHFSLNAQHSTLNAHSSGRHGWLGKAELQSCLLGSSGAHTFLPSCSVGLLSTGILLNLLRKEIQSTVLHSQVSSRSEERPLLRSSQNVWHKLWCSWCSRGSGAPGAPEFVKPKILDMPGTFLMTSSHSEVGQIFAQNHVFLMLLNTIHHHSTLTVVYHSPSSLSGPAKMRQGQGLL